MEKSNHLNSMITRLITSSDPAEIKEIYREWSESYNQDLDEFGYVAPQIGAELFDQAYPNDDGLIFDAGCGTGLTGQALAERGYTKIHGADFSPAMLAEARRTGHYEALTEIDFRFPLDIDTATYDGVLCIGVYTSPLKEHFLPELVRITKPQGVICVSCRFDYFDEDLHLQAKAQEEAGAVAIEAVETKPYMVGQQADAAYMVLRSC